jgi:hypothetical protein
MFVSDIPLSCINSAAIEFNVPSKLIITVLQIERGKNNQAVKNSNGTYDLGSMQINTRWMPILAKYSISREDIQHDPCINVRIGAWILAKAIASDNDLLKGISNYHSRTPIYNNRYAQKVKVRFTQLNHFLQQDVLQD